MQEVLKADQLVKKIGRDMAQEVVRWLETELFVLKDATVGNISAGRDVVFETAVRAAAVRQLAHSLRCVVDAKQSPK